LKANTKKRLTKAGWLLFYLYIILLSYFLFFSEHYGRDYSHDYRYNLELFKEIKRFIIYRQQLGFESFVVNILGNILAFAPFGFLLPLLNPKYRRFFFILFLSLLFSVAVETVQLLLQVGIFDVDDIMLNTLGGMIGYMIYLTGSLLFRKHGTKHKKNRRK
jgi:glycopeptide antibiotics resistance protein